MRKININQGTGKGMNYARGLLLVLLLLCGCHRRLSIQTQYWDERQLASSYVNSPDPKQFCPDIGQKLYISWTVPPQWLEWPDLAISLQLRYRNRAEDFLQLPISHRRGTHVLPFMNEIYAETGGVLTYRAELVGDGCVQEVWEHTLWGIILPDLPCDLAAQGDQTLPPKEA